MPRTFLLLFAAALTLSACGETRAERAGSGAVIGGVTGFAVGAVCCANPPAGIKAGTLIGAGAGALVGALGGAGIGAATGGLLGYLLDHGLNQSEAHYYHERVKHGAALVIVRAEGRETDARAIMQRHGAHDFHTRPVA